MHDAQKPNPDESAFGTPVMAVTVVWPSEYGIDPTGVGGLLGLTEMGEINAQLADEAEADRLMLQSPEPQSSLQPGLMDVIFGAIVGTAHA